jgi:leucyl aminopeptidase
VIGETVQVRSAAAGVDVEDATLIAGVMEGLEPLTGSEEILETVDQAILEAAGFEGKPGQMLTLPHADAKAILLVGLGEESSFDSIRKASGNAIRGVKTARAVTLLALVDLEGATRAVVEGSLLGGYQFRTYKTDDNGLDAELVDIVGADEEELAAATLGCEATILARDWVNTPAKDKSPETLAGLIEAAAEAAGVVAEIWDRPRIEKEKLGALLGVAAGSDRDPRVVILQYRPGGATTHLALVGKGIVFDTGGLSLKTANHMEEMKDDMSGAAVVAAATIGIARLGLPVNITVIAPLTDNAVGGDATRPGDVLRPVDGPTIEVLNTDAEGRLILADGLGLAKRYEPDLTIDVATLTGAAAVALGKQVAAIFGSDSDVSTRILEAAFRAGEEFWELPLFDGYRKSIDSNVADIKNISGGRYGGAIVAALFLKEYAGEGPWAHLDIAGPARSHETTGEFVKGASGVGVRTLIEVARSMAETA